MNNDFADVLVGRRIACVMCLYFNPTGGTLSSPLAVIIPSKNNAFIEIDADGSGGVRIKNSDFKRLYYDMHQGFSLIAPLLVSLKDTLDGSEIISSADYRKSINFSEISIVLDCAKTVLLKFTDDQIFVDLN